ncbi:MAG: class II fructose-bisphosphate aldolase [bacterium]|nr:class II fructose-bisphosphate aldolase [bacterium]
MKNLKYYLNKAKKDKWAVGQFNFSTLEHLRGILEAARNTKSPVILGASEGELNYMGLEETIALVEIYRKKMKIKAFLNLDHGKDLSIISKCIKAGFDYIHFDGSFLPVEDNIKILKKVVKKAGSSVLIEGEKDNIEKMTLSSAEESADFSKRTGIGSLALALGNSHGYFKEVNLNFERLEEISKKTDCFLVLHGGSKIPDEQIRKAISLGIVKININSELRMAWKENLASSLAGDELKPYKILPAAKEAVQKKVEEKIKLFGSFGKI